MKKLRFTRLLVTFFILFAFNTPAAKAGLLIEPLIGYSFNTKLKLDEPGETENKGSGTSYGGRLGYQNLGFSLGLDYLKSSIGLDDKAYKSDVSMSEWAAFVGFRFPILIKVYAAYIFSATGETDYLDGTTQKLSFSEGAGTKFGVGFTGIPFIDINLEYRSGTFGEYRYGGFRVKENTNYSSYLLSLSAPFDI
jgi:hypothetical protein